MLGYYFLYILVEFYI